MPVQLQVFREGEWQTVPFGTTLAEGLDSGLTTMDHIEAYTRKFVGLHGHNFTFRRITVEPDPIQLVLPF